MINHSNFDNALPSLAAAACLVGPCVMVLSDILTIVLNNKTDPIAQTISGYAIGPYGWLEKIGMAMVATSFFLIGLNLIKVQYKRKFRLMGICGYLFVIAAFGFLMTSLFNTNVTDNISTIHGEIHRLSLIISSLSFYPSCLLLMRLMIKKPGLSYFGAYSGFTFLIGLAVLAWLFFSYDRTGYLGLTERVLAGFSLLWIVFVGPKVVRLRKSFATVQPSVVEKE